MLRYRQSGYGHATRVSAFACHFLSLNPSPILYIVSSAPKHVFSDSVAIGAVYRYAEIDPVIVQPLALVLPLPVLCALLLSISFGVR